MKTQIFIILTLSFIIFAFAFAGEKGKKVAIVKIKKGKAVVISANGDKLDIKKGQWIEQGAVIKTEAGSSVKLSFIDKSTVNIGPRSEMKIEKFSKNEAGVLNVISGKIRSRVTKDYLNMEKNKSKLFVRSKSAVMGIRGTDFVFSTSRKTGASTAILFEGSVVFNKIGKSNKHSDLESIVNKGFRIKPGQFSVSHRSRKSPTIPSKLSSRQFKALEKNENFIKAKKVVAVKSVRSVTPPGLSGSVVSSDSQLSLSKSNVKQDNSESIEKSKGFVSKDDYKPTDGSLVHLESGVIIPIGNDAHFDKNNKEWVSNSVGSVDEKGSYVPPKSFSITDEGKLIKEVGNRSQVVTIEYKGFDDTPSLDKMNTVEGNPGKSPASIDDRFNNQDPNQEEDEDSVMRAPTPPGEPGWQPGDISNRPNFRNGPRPIGPNRTRINGSVTKGN